MWYHRPIISTLARLNQENQESEVGWGYIVKLFQKKNKKKQLISIVSSLLFLHN